MKKLFYAAYSSIPSSLPSSLQIIKTCENLMKKGFVNVSEFKGGMKEYYN